MVSVLGATLNHIPLKYMHSNSTRNQIRVVHCSWAYKWLKPSLRWNSCLIAKSHKGAPQPINNEPLRYVGSIHYSTPIVCLVGPWNIIIRCLESLVSCSTFWASNCYIPRAHWTNNGCWVMLCLNIWLHAQHIHTRLTKLLSYTLYIYGFESLLHTFACVRRK